MDPWVVAFGTSFVSGLLTLARKNISGIMGNIFGPIQPYLSAVKTIARMTPTQGIYRRSLCDVPTWLVVHGSRGGGGWRLSGYRDTRKRSKNKAGWLESPLP